MFRANLLKKTLTRKQRDDNENVCKRWIINTLPTICRWMRLTCLKSSSQCVRRRTSTHARGRTAPYVGDVRTTCDVRTVCCVATQLCPLCPLTTTTKKWQEWKKWSDVLVQWYDTRRTEAILEAPTNQWKNVKTFYMYENYVISHQYHGFAYFQANVKR